MWWREASSPFFLLAFFSCLVFFREFHRQSRASGIWMFSRFPPAGCSHQAHLLLRGLPVVCVLHACMLHVCVYVCALPVGVLHVCILGVLLVYVLHVCVYVCVIHVGALHVCILGVLHVCAHVCALHVGVLHMCVVGVLHACVLHVCMHGFVLHVGVLYMCILSVQHVYVMRGAGLRGVPWCCSLTYPALAFLWGNRALSVLRGSSLWVVREALPISVRGHFACTLLASCAAVGGGYGW